MSDEATAAPDGEETAGADNSAQNNSAEEAPAARRRGGRAKAEDSPQTKAAKDRARWALWIRSNLEDADKDDRECHDLPRGCLAHTFPQERSTV